MEHLEQLRYSGLFDSRVPRYTSYPPANRFIPTEGSINQVRWLQAIPHDATVSVYVHIPYCESLCWFCACRTQAAESSTMVTSYVHTLIREIALVRRQLPDAVSLSHLYMGGGTPTILRPTQMSRLMNAIHTAFPVTEGFECSVEIDSAQVSASMIDSLLTAGMSRAIVGVQDFDPAIQSAIGRNQSFEQTLRAVRALRQAGLQNLDMELLYGLPKQTAATIAETTQQVLALEPDRVAVCEYSHRPNLAKRQIMIDARLLPAAEDAFLMSQVARQNLLTDGYEAVGVDHFVRPGDRLIAARDSDTLKRDFQGYSDNASHALIGLGASAISRLPQGYVQNASSTSVYSKHISKNRLAGNKGYTIKGSDQPIAYMIEMLMCRFEIDIEMVKQRFGGSHQIIDAAIGNLRKIYAPHLEVSSHRLVVKPYAHPLARLICNTLDGAGRADADF